MNTQTAPAPTTGSTFSQLEKIVTKVLVNFTDDLYKHDKAVLEQYNGPFCYAYRPSGTDLVKLLPNLDDVAWGTAFKDLTREEKRKSLLENVMYLNYRDRNKFALYFDGKKLHKKTIEQVSAIFINHVNKMK